MTTTTTDKPRSAVLARQLMTVAADIHAARCWKAAEDATAVRAAVLDDDAAYDAADAAVGSALRAWGSALRTRHLMEVQS